MNAALLAMAPGTGLPAVGAPAGGGTAAPGSTAPAFAALLATAGETLLAHASPDGTTDALAAATAMPTASELATGGAAPQGVPAEPTEASTTPLPLLELPTQPPPTTSAARNGSLGAAARALPHDALQHLQQAMAQATAMLAVLPPSGEASEAHLGGMTLDPRTPAALGAGADDEPADDTSLLPTVPMALVAAWVPPGAATGGGPIDAPDGEAQAPTAAPAKAAPGPTAAAAAAIAMPPGASMAPAGAAAAQAAAGTNDSSGALTGEAMPASAPADKAPRKGATAQELAPVATAPGAAAGSTAASASLAAHPASAGHQRAPLAETDSLEPDSARPAEVPTSHAAAPQAATARGEVIAPTSFAQQLRHAFEAQLSAPVNSPQFGSALGLQISTLLRNGVPEARLQLNPAELGPVAVQLTLQGSAAQVHLAADHALTRQALEQAMPQLATALQDAGFTLAGGGVSQQPGFAQTQQQAQEQAQQRAQASGTPILGGARADAVGASEGPARRGPATTRAGLVDFYA